MRADAGVAEWPKAADSRSALAGVPRFKSWPRHHPPAGSLIRSTFAAQGSIEWTRLGSLAIFAGSVVGIGTAAASRSLKVE
jgi:hypothetical protein